MTTRNELTPLGEYIKARLDDLGWSQNKLGEVSGVGSSSVSKLMRGLIAATHENIESIADALRIDPIKLKEVAGLRTITPPSMRDPSVEYLAQQLDGLPDSVRAEAIDALGAQLDAIYRVAGIKPTKRLAEDITKDYSELSPLEDTARLMKILKRRDPELYEALITGKLLE